MEYEEELEKILGQENIKLLLTEVHHGRVSREQLKAIASGMCGDVHGVFVHNERAMEPRPLCVEMLDSWYNSEICDPKVDALQRLIDILTAPDVALNHLAAKMNLPATSIIKVPWVHLHITEEFLKSIEASGKGYPADEERTDCVSHCVGMAIVEYLHTYGFHADLGDVKNALEEKSENLPANPREYDKTEIQVCNTMQEESEITIEVKILTQHCEVDKINNTFKTEKIAGIDENLKTVLRWVTPRGPHVIYSEAYDHAEGIYSCRSSVDNEDTELTIHNSLVYAIDYLSVARID